MSFATAEFADFSGSILDRIELFFQFLFLGAMCLLSLFHFWASHNPEAAKKFVLSFLPAVPAWMPTRKGALCALHTVLLVFALPLVAGFALGLWTLMGARWVCRSGRDLASAVYRLRTADMALRAALEAQLADLNAKRVDLVDSINVKCLQKRRELFEEIASFRSGLWYVLPQEFHQDFLDRLERLRIGVPRVALIQSTRGFVSQPGLFAAFLYRHDRDCAMLEHKIGHIQDIIAGLTRQLRSHEDLIADARIGLEDERVYLRKVLATMKKYGRIAKDAGIPYDRRGVRNLTSEIKVRYPLWERKSVVVSGPSSQKVGKLADVGTSGPTDLVPVLPSGCTLAVASSSEPAPTVVDTKQTGKDSGSTAGQTQPPPQQQQQVLPVLPAAPVRPALPAPPVQLALPAAPMPQEQQPFKSLIARLRQADENKRALEAEHRSRVQFDARLEAARRSYQQAQHERDMEAQRQRELAAQFQRALDADRQRRREMEAQYQRDIPVLVELFSRLRIRDPVVAALPLAASPAVVAVAPCDEMDLVVADEVEAVPTPAVSEPVAMEVAQPDEDAPSAAPITNANTAPGPSADRLSIGQLPDLPESDDEDYLNQDVTVPAAQSSKLPVIMPVASSSTIKHTVSDVAKPVHVDYGSVTFDLSVPRQVPAPPSPMAVSTFGTGGPRFSDAFLAAAAPSVPTASVVVPSAKGKEVARAPAAADKVVQMSPPAPAMAIDDEFHCPRLLNDDDLKELDEMLEQAIREDEVRNSAKKVGGPSSSAVSVPATPTPAARAPAVGFAATVDAQDQAVWDSLADASMDQEDAEPAPAAAPKAPVPAPKVAPAPVVSPAPAPPSSIPPPGQRRILAPRRRTARAAAAPPAAQPQVSPPAAPPPAQSMNSPAQQSTAAPQQALQQAPPATSSQEPREKLHAYEMAALVAKRSDSVTKLGRAMLAEAFEHHLKASNECTPEELRAARNNIRDYLDEIMQSFQPAVAGTYECSDCDVIIEKWVHQYRFSAHSRVAEAERKMTDSMKKGAKGAPGKFRRRYLRFAGWTGY